MAVKIKKQPSPTFNEAQKEVINHNLGSCLVIAVAGAGKTTAVIHRIKRMIDENVAKNNEILATTFTKKAANEMNSRLKRLDIDIEEMQVSTFHSICYSIIRDELPFLPGSKKYELDSAGSKEMGLIKLVLGYQNMNWKDANISDVQFFISNCKNGLIKPNQAKHEFDIRFVQAYQLFERFRENQGFITFDDMLIKAWEILKNNPHILRKYQTRYKFVIVDEFQDTNTAQYEIMEMLSLPENNLMVVGDDDQSIYSWRGAVPDYMLDFQKKHNSKAIRMEKNYRCPKIIQEISNPLISINIKRLDKTLRAEKNMQGSLTHIKSYDFDEEALMVFNHIRSLNDFSNKRYNEIAILYRTNAQSRAIEDLFIEKEIPYEVVGGVNFYKRKEIKDILSYFYAALNIDNKADEGFERIINVPFRYLGKSFFADIRKFQERMKYSFESALRECPMDNRTEKAVDNFLRIIDEIRKRKEENPSHLIGWLVNEIDYIQYLEKSDGGDSTESNRVSNVKELIRASGKHKTITKYINYIHKLSSKKKKTDKNKIILSTIHRAKGLEWNNVFVIGCNELIFPHSRSITDDQLEEERRLAYVAVTRPKEKLFLSSVELASVQGGIRELAPSRFLLEMGILDSMDEAKLKKAGV